jgi:hypothetical protein
MAEIALRAAYKPDQARTSHSVKPDQTKSNQIKPARRENGGLVEREKWHPKDQRDERDEWPDQTQSSPIRVNQTKSNRIKPAGARGGTRMKHELRRKKRRGIVKKGQTQSKSKSWSNHKK